MPLNDIPIKIEPFCIINAKNITVFSNYACQTGNKAEEEQPSGHTVL
jgi:hypothetical protein